MKKSLERSRGKVTLVTQGFRFHSKRGGKPVKESEKTYFNSVALGFILSIDYKKARAEVQRLDRFLQKFRPVMVVNWARMVAVDVVEVLKLLN